MGDIIKFPEPRSSDGLIECINRIEQLERSIGYAIEGLKGIMIHQENFAGKEYKDNTVYVIAKNTMEKINEM